MRRTGPLSALLLAAAVQSAAAQDIAPAVPREAPPGEPVIKEEHQPEAAPKAAPRIEVRQAEGLGSYLTDDSGRALYLFTADTQGSRDRPAASACHDACLTAWPPMIVEAQPETGDAAKAGLAGSFEREDGRRQATYAGRPLYYWMGDRGEERTHGQDKHHFGGEWYLVAPDGERVEGRPERQRTD